MLKDSVQAERWRDYCASVLWSIGKLLGRENYPYPEYTDYIDDKPKDTRTAHDIISGLIGKLSKGGEKSD